MRRRVLLSFLAALLAVAAAVRPSGGATTRPNVILVSIDTLRADHLGCYGYSRRTSPRIDAFSREALLFEQAIAAAPSTLASHASMFTGLVAPHHGASIARRTALPPSLATLAEILKDDGYATASWNGGAQLHRMWGLDQGFDEYHSFGEYEPETRGTTGPIAPGDRLDTAVRSALSWLDRQGSGRPFFLFLHSYEVHSPYTPDPELRARFGRFPTRLGDAVSVLDLWQVKEGQSSFGPADLAHIVASYDAEIVSVDRGFGRLLDGLRQRGLEERTVVVLTSDHGEEFGEHGVVGWHSHTLFDELLRVPLVVRLPGGAHAGHRIESQVSGIDLAPTVLDAAGLVPPATFQGRSLLDLVEGAASSPSPFVLSGRDSKRRDLLSLRGEGWKWIRFDGLYDLRADPGETRNLRNTSEEARARQRVLRSRADRWLNARRPPAVVDVEPGQAMEERLRALGYID